MLKPYNPLSTIQHTDTSFIGFVQSRFTVVLWDKLKIIDLKRPKRIINIESIIDFGDHLNFSK